MVISISHTIDHISKDQYRKFTDEEFIQYVVKIATKMGIGEEIAKFIKIDQIDPLGQCFGLIAGEHFIFVSLTFSNKLLDGKSYTLSQIDDAIKHELCHYIANQRTETENGHNEYWQSVCKEFDYKPSETLPFLKYNISLHSEIILDSIPKFKYILKCNKCGKIFRQSNQFDIRLFQYFLLCTCGLNISYGKLPIQTNCCNATYRYEADAEELSHNLINYNAFPQIQKSIQKEIDNYNHLRE